VKSIIRERWQHKIIDKSRALNEKRDVDEALLLISTSKAWKSVTPPSSNTKNPGGRYLVDHHVAVFSRRRAERLARPAQRAETHHMPHMDLEELFAGVVPSRSPNG